MSPAHLDRIREAWWWRFRAERGLLEPAPQTPQEMLAKFEHLARLTNG